MKKLLLNHRSNWTLGLVFLALTMVACNSGPTLQSYFVEKSEDPNFISLTLPSSILNIAVDSLQADQQDALATLKKLNVLIYRKSVNEPAQLDEESDVVLKILSNSAYTELMKLNAEDYKGAVSYLGTEDAIKEIIVFAKSGSDGFALIRVIGEGMNPKYLKPFVEALQTSKASAEDFKNLLPDLGI
ncbi:MAG: DUF4252 domain-containing protein [Flavobacteriaceae bacterium]|nr:DUF4252 domain-containing protein [Flavobacteriaceae bacterium]